MSEECTHNCSTCSANCSSKQDPKSLLQAPHQLSSIKKVIAVVSGKGGVGKSLVTSMLAVHMQRKGFASAILDADITGPSIPKAFGLTERAIGNDNGLLPSLSEKGTQIMSANLLLNNDTDPILWRGAMISNLVTQFWTGCIWSDVDYMFIDMPPGTGDVPLTVFQSVPLDGIIIVTSPQELVSMIVAKAVNMANDMNIPIIGFVENMSYTKCPDCGKEFNVFGESHIDEIAKEYGIPVLAKLPIDPSVAAACDAGKIESVEGEWLKGAADLIANL